MYRYICFLYSGGETKTVYVWANDDNEAAMLAVLENPGWLCSGTAREE